MSNLQGQLLIAAPQLLDPNFLRTVVLMVQHSSEGALGLVLNRPTNATIKQAWEQVRDTGCLRDDLLRWGGPCQGPLTALHVTSELSDIEVLSTSLFFCGEPDKLTTLVDEPTYQARFFVGYAGWGPGQLESEMEQGGWLTTPAKAEHVFSEDADLWQHVLKQVAQGQLLSAIKVKHVPPDPSLN